MEESGLAKTLKYILSVVWLPICLVGLGLMVASLPVVVLWNIVALIMLVLVLIMLVLIGLIGRELLLILTGR